MTESLRTGDPRRVGAYRLVGLLGEGGQGTVYRGESPDGTAVAVKLLHARFSGDAKARSRFAAELGHAERVAPFCTARVLDADLDGDRPYIVSEFIDGPSLAELISRGHAPAGPALERLAIATVTALAAIHEAGVVHRDFKPNNVIMGADGARVIDFGIARALEATGTLSSAVVGTPAYMSPEQIGGGSVGPATDIFAWGCTIAYASNGFTPFGQDSIPAVMHRILHEEPELGGLSGPLRDIAAACLGKDPARRPAARRILLRLLGAAESTTAPETLLSEGTRASATRPGEWSRTLIEEPPRPYTPMPAEHPAGAGAYAAAGGGPGVPLPSPVPSSGQAMPPVPPPVTFREGAGDREAGRGGNGGRVAARTTAVAAVVLGTATFLPWARVGVAQNGTSVVTDVSGVSGVHTVWGVLTLIAAVVALNLAVTHEFAPRLSTVWAALPGGVAVALVGGLLINRQDLRGEHPHYGRLSSAELHGLGMSFHISLAMGVFVALAAAAAVTTAALASLRS